MDLHSNHETPSSFFKFSPTDFEYDPKSPPAPSTPIIYSKFMDFYDEFALHPATKSLSIQSDKENNDKISNKQAHTHFMPCISPIAVKSHSKPSKSPKKCILQLPDLKLPKTITQFELELSSTPSQVISSIDHHPLSITPVPLPQFADSYNSFWTQTDFNNSPFPISHQSYYNHSSPYSSHWDPNHEFNDLFPFYQSASAPPILSVSVPPLVECPAKRTYSTMSGNQDYNNMQHASKRRKISHSGEYRGSYHASYEATSSNSKTNGNVLGEFQQYQPGNISSDINNGAISMSIAESENEPILSPHKRRNGLHSLQEEDKNNNNLTKRALFKEKRNLNINIHSNQANVSTIAPDTAPNNNQAQSGENDSLQRMGIADNDRSALDNAISAPIANINNSNTNLDWFGNDENINTLNGNNHTFGDMHMFPMAEDIGLPNFMMNDLNHNEMMDMDLHQQLPLNQAIKQESNNILPPVIPPNYAIAPSTVYHPTQFSVSTSPPQQSSMFMDQINTNSSIYQQNDFTYQNNSNNNNVLIRSRAIVSGAGPNSVRPSNLPTLRRSASQPQQVHNVSSSNGSNLGVDFIKPSKSEISATQISNISASKSRTTHVLTPFDYPLSNPAISSSAGVSHDTHSYYARYISNIKRESNNNSNNNNNNTNNSNNNNNNNNNAQLAPIHSAPLYSISSTYPSSQRNSQSLSATPNPSNTHFSLSSSLLNIPQHLSTNQRSSHSSSFPATSYNDAYGNKAGNDHFNFLWWYPEVKFCELDPSLVPLP